MLKIIEKRLYKVKKGQTLKSIAAAFSTTTYALVARNGLWSELYEGQLIVLPEGADIYTVQAGDTKSLLCGSDENYKKKNGTEVFYPGMKVCL